MAASEQEQPKPKTTYSKPFVAMCLILNIALSISIVLLNKTVYTTYGFPNMTLTCIHFLCTTIGMFCCRAMRLFEPRALPLLKMIPVSMTFCGFVVLTNLSLQTNTVGTYQLIKTMTTPCIIVLQTYFYNRSFSLGVKLTLVPITLGVLLNSYFDLQFSILGICYAAAGVLVTSLYQVWIAEKQKEFGVNSMQLLYYQAPLSAIGVGLIIPFFEPVIGPGGLFGPWSAEALRMVGLTGAVAFAINLSIFWIIGNTSPVTYNMVGHLKFCLTLAGGFLLFRDAVAPVQILGIILTFSGILAYTHFKLEELKKQKQQTASEKEQEQLNLKVVTTVEPNSNGTKQNGVSA